MTFSPYQTSALIVGPSGRGKSTVAAGLIERLRAADYTYCIIDPEGDYDAIESTLVLGGPAHVPTIDECVQLLCKPEQNLVINLLGLKLDERPWFFLALLARIRDLRARTGRPHWLLIDEAHHMMPADWKPCDEIIPVRLQGVVMVSVRPALIARSVLRALDTLVVVGDRLEELLKEFTERESCVNATVPDWQEGEALLWSRTRPSAAMVVRLEPSRTQRRRHLRKYAQGELPRDRSFYFRGPDGRLNLRAHNLFLFLDMADGVDDETWLFHLRRGEISHWLRDGLKDEELAERVAAVEQGDGDDAANSRRQIRHLIETLYTAPAGTASAGS